MKNEVKKELYTREFKLTHFGYGDWMDEPDSFEFEYRGYKCLVFRICTRESCEEEAYFGGHLCGYVVLPAEHPMCGKDYFDIGIDCHCGLTYGEMTESGFMIGFDCGHSMDLIPSMSQIRKRYSIHDVFPIPEGYEDSPLFNPKYKNMSYCIKQCKSIVKQLIELEVPA